MASRTSNEKAVAGPLTMDSRKFLGAINSSLQSRITAMEHRVRVLGRSAGANWKLTSLGTNNLFIEDTDSHTYYGATYRQEKGGNVVIENVRPLRIVESKKKTLFEANCKQLVDAVEANDQRAMATAFSKMAAQRFSSRTVPFSGMVRTHDNVTRFVNLASESVVDESVRPKLVAAIVEGLTSKVTLEEGIPVRGTFVGSKLKLPVSEWLCRKAVARHMRRIAEDAYWSPGFQDRIHDVAKLIYEDKVEDAVKLVTGFLVENQEFTLLNREQTRRLVENALATKACFNQVLCNDTATLFWRTNLKVNKNTIVKEWRTTAKKASHPTLLENVTLLEQSPNFEAAFDKFINLVFNEAVGPKDVQVHAYKTALVALKDTPKIKESGELSGKIDELIERLEQPEQDHAVIAEVEDLLAEVKNEMNALESLDDFDQMPGGAGGDDDAAAALGAGGDDGMGLGGDAGGKGGKGGTTVNFNISINGDGVNTGGLGGDAGGDMGGEEGGDDELEALLGGGGDEGGEEEGGDDELAALLGGGGGDEEGGGEEEGGEDELAALLKGESRGRGRDPINESPNDGDPYSYNKPAAGKTGASNKGGIGADYGTKPIEIAEDCHRAVLAMVKIAEHNDLEGTVLLDRATELAQASLKATGIIVPERKVDEAIEQLCDAFFDELDRRGVTMGEDQYKGPWRHVWGRKKAAINRQESKKGRTRSEGLDRGNADRMGRRPVVETCVDDKGKDHCKPGSKPKKKGPPKVEWVEEQADGKKGIFGGVGFIFDHANGQADPVILSEDGQVEVPIPAGLYESAFAAADLGQGDPMPFMRWLVQNIEQLRPISEDDTGLNDEIDQAINEATVKIKTNADGGVDIEVDSADPSVSINDPLDAPMGDPMDGDLELPPEGEVVTDVAPGMEPVDALPPIDGGEGAEVGADAGDDGMPNFEGGDIGGGEEAAGGDEEEGEEGGEESGDEGDEGGEEGGEEGPPNAEKKPKKDDDEGVAEDRDMTTPTTRKYNTSKDDPRKEAQPKKPGKSGTNLDGFGDGKADTPGVPMKKITPKGKKS